MGHRKWGWKISPRSEHCEMFQPHLRCPIFSYRNSCVRTAKCEICIRQGAHSYLVMRSAKKSRERRAKNVKSFLAHSKANSNHVLLRNERLDKLPWPDFFYFIRMRRV